MGIASSSSQLIILGDNRNSFLVPLTRASTQSIMAEVVGLLLALPPILEKLIAAGKNLALRLEALQNPRAKLGDLTYFTEHDARLLVQFKVGQQICDDSTVDIYIKNSLSKDFSDIQKAMLDAIECVERVEKASKMHRFWVMDRPRKALEESIRRLQASIEHFQDTTQLVHISSTLPSQVLLQSDDFQLTAGTESITITEGVLMCRGHLARTLRRTQPKTGWFLCERRPYIEAARNVVGKDIRYLSESLASATECNSILNVVGYRDLPNIQHFEIVFDIPDHLNFVGSLRQFIHSHDPISLNSRIDLSVKLANAILLVHRLNLVHKNVNSGNVIFLTGHQVTAAEEVSAELILINWHLVRKASAATRLLGEPKWWQGIYQHPSRQMNLAEKEYTMAHDIYSLGVCMLEILLWSTLVIGKLGAPPTAADMFKTEALHLKLLSETEWEEVSRRSIEEGILLDPRDTQKVLISLATRKLPSAAGNRLSQLVLSCLKSLEGGFGEQDIVESSRVDTGLNFVTAVKDSLMQLCI